MRTCLAVLVVVAAIGAVHWVSGSVVCLAEDAPADRVVVMYFHRTQRCPTCLKMGVYTEEAVNEGFAAQLKSGMVSLHFIDFQDDKNAAFTKAYAITGPTLLVAKVSGDKVAEYRNLKDMWTKVRDQKAFHDYVKSNVKSYLK